MKPTQTKKVRREKVKWISFCIDESDYKNEDYPYEVLARCMSELQAKYFVITYTTNIDCSEGQNFYIEGVYRK